MSHRETYKVIDVFAGPGGLGEGFAALGHGEKKSKFRLALSIEKDPVAHSTLMLRSFYRQFDPEKIPQEYWSYARGEITKAALFDFYPRQAKAAAEEAQCIELGKTPPHEVKNLINQRLNGSEKWVLVGGPPCQAYSLVGRARMRSTNPDFEDDERHFLYREYFNHLSHQPLNTLNRRNISTGIAYFSFQIIDIGRSPSYCSSSTGPSAMYALFWFSRTKS